MYLASSNKMYLVSDTFSCHTLHCTGTPAGHSMDTVLILLTLPNQIHKEMLMKLLNYAIYAPSESIMIHFLKSSLLCCLCFTILLSDVFLPASCFCSVFSSARLWEPITAKPRSLLVFWFVELAQSLLRSFLFPVESLAGSVNCKMIGYSSSHENIMVYLLK